MLVHRTRRNLSAKPVQSSNHQPYVIIISNRMCNVLLTPDIKHPKTLFSRLYSILLCLPSPFHPLNWANLAVNTLLLAAAAEFVITPFFDKAQNVTFTRVGAIYANGAKIVVRYPSPSVEDSSVDVLWREVSNGTHWQQGPTANLSQHSDWVATVKVENLLPDTQYECKLSTRLC